MGKGENYLALTLHHAIKFYTYPDSKHLHTTNQKVAENIVGKRENAGHQHFLLFSTMFSKAVFFRVAKNQVCVVKVL